MLALERLNLKVLLGFGAFLWIVMATVAAEIFGTSIDLTAFGFGVLCKGGRAVRANR